MKAKILETFQSIQGEGLYAGVKQIFIRFFECNMPCVWCDTPHSIGDTSARYKEYTLDDLCSEIGRFDRDCHSVSITGGEPMLQKDFLKMFLPRIRATGMKSYLETNGIFHEELRDIIDNVDIIAMDIKLPSSTKCKAYWHEHEEFLKIAANAETFIKTVVSSDTDSADIEKAVELVARISRQTPLILQPNTYELSNGVMKKCLAFHDYALQYLPNARVMTQMHKQMKLR